MHARVNRVYDPGLASDPGHDVARRQMTGFGGMLSFELDGTVDEPPDDRVEDLVARLDRVTSTGVPAEPALARV